MNIFLSIVSVYIVLLLGVVLFNKKFYKYYSNDFILDKTIDIEYYLKIFPLAIIDLFFNPFSLSPFVPITYLALFYYINVGF